MSNVLEADLRQTERTAQLLADAQRRALIGDSEFERLRFFTTAVHALRRGVRPCALFATLARNRCWGFGSHEDEDHARRALRRLEPGIRSSADPACEPMRAETLHRVERTRPAAPVPQVRSHPPPLPVSTPTAERSNRSSSHLPHDLRRAGEILLGINLGNSSGTVPENNSRRLDAKLLAEVRRRAVPELVG